MVSVIDTNAYGGQLSTGGRHDDLDFRHVRFLAPAVRIHDRHGERQDRSGTAFPSVARSWPGQRP